MRLLEPTTRTQQQYLAALPSHRPRMRLLLPPLPLLGPLLRL